ncbi:MAG: ATP-binding cassette domain-containing protein [Geopsychrobacter sp.]|nr:ATP-binding cassette domain-containing protein [Geopsychrobacter sp.]
MSDALLTLESICLVRQGRHILENINCAVHPGEIITLIGPNGAGKTSLLKVALGLVSADSGRVVKSPNLRIGYMPQKLIVERSFPLSVARFMRLTGRYTQTQLQEVLDEVGAGHLFNSSLADLSGGELQRVLLGRALLRRPQLLVLDEPVQGVDVQGQVDLFELIGRIRKRFGCAVLMVSHDLHLVMAATDRVICLNQHICCTGSPAVVQRDEKFLELFGPAILPHLAIYNHDQQHQHDHCPHQGCSCPLGEGKNHVQ